MTCTKYDGRLRVVRSWRRERTVVRYLKCDSCEHRTKQVVPSEHVPRRFPSKEHA